MNKEETKQTEAEKAWKDKRKESADDYSGLPQYSATYKAGHAEGIEQFKAALKAEIEKRVNITDELFSHRYLNISEIMQAIDEVKPLNN